MAFLVLLLATKALADDPIHYSDPLSLHNVAYKTNPSSEDTIPARTDNKTIQPQSTHPIRASSTISEEALRQYLEAKNSPLLRFADVLNSSPYWSTIIAICTIEEYSCSVNPYGSNNLWGLMSKEHLISYPTLVEGIQAISDFLERAERNGRTTVESFRGWYCASACTTWEPTVIKTKLLLEAL